MVRGDRGGGADKTVRGDRGADDFVWIDEFSVVGRKVDCRLD